MRLKPTERLKEIENHHSTYVDDHYAQEDLPWLITRVHRLTKALEMLRDGHELQFKDCIPDKNPYFIAKEALESEE